MFAYLGFLPVVAFSIAIFGFQQGVFSVPLYLPGVLILAQINVTSKPGLYISDSAGVIQVFVSSDWTSISDLVNLMQHYIDHPERHEGRVLHISMNESSVSGNVVIGDVGGSVNHAPPPPGGIGDDSQPPRKAPDIDLTEELAEAHVHER